MEFTFSDAAVEALLAGARTVDSLEAAFARILDLRAALKDPGRYGRLFWPDLDAIVPQVARRLKLRDRPAAKSNDNVCVLATAFYATGGHTRVAADIIRKLRPAPVPILLTNAYGQLNHLELLNHPQNNSGLGESALVQVEAPSLVGKALQLYMMLAALRPTRIVLLSHPMDIVAAVAAWPFRDVVEFVHHADHVPAIGAALPFSAHVDVTYTCHTVCRAELETAVYAGMSAEVPAAAAAVRKVGERPLRIATCGNPNKYQGHAAYRWVDYAAAALHAAPGAELIHIGPVSAAMAAEIREGLAAAGLDPGRYVFAGVKDSLPAALLEAQADLYLSSYPEAGGKANLEAMSAGLPAIVPVDADAPRLVRFSLPLARYVEVERPEGLPDALAAAARLAQDMTRPEQAEALRRELARFDDFVAGHLAASAPADHA